MSYADNDIEKYKAPAPQRLSPFHVVDRIQPEIGGAGRSQKGQSQVKVTPKRSRNAAAYSSSSVSARSSRSPFLVMIRRISLNVTRPSGVALEQIRPRVKCDCGEV